MEGRPRCERYSGRAAWHAANLGQSRPCGSLREVAGGRRPHRQPYRVAVCSKGCGRAVDRAQKMLCNFEGPPPTGVAMVSPVPGASPALDFAHA
jgi:hypothetical protein